MKLTFIANACCIYESQGFKILCDPWLTEGAFYGSWFHYPPLKTRPEDVADFDALYISHLHPDHFDPETLKHFDKTKPVIILDQEPNYLNRMVKAEGFTNIWKIPDGHTRQIGPFSITMFGPFCGHPFFDTQMGNVLDSAIVVDDGTYKIFNANDNTPDVDSAHRLRERFGRFDIAQLNYNAAGPYPSCFSNLSELQKGCAQNEVLKRNLDHVVELCRILEPKLFVPFAGEYVLGGRNYEKDKYLGTTTPHFAAGYVSMALFEQETCAMAEQQVLALALGEAMFHPAKLAHHPYTYDNDSLPSSAELAYLVQEGRKNLYKVQERLNCYPDCTVLINGKYILDLNRSRSREDSKVYLKAEMDPAILYGILNKKYHWNNAEIGCHIEFHREPDVYLPDAHWIMSYFHV